MSGFDELTTSSAARAERRFAAVAREAASCVSNWSTKAVPHLRHRAGRLGDLYVAVVVIHVHLHLPEVLVRELVELEIHEDVTAEEPVVERFRTSAMSGARPSGLVLTAAVRLVMTGFFFIASAPP